MILLSFAIACQSEGIKIGEPLPDFTLRDVNENSITYDSEVSFSDYKNQVSVWYFGHST